METKDKNAAIPDVKSKETKIIVLVFHPSGKALVKQFTHEGLVSDDFILNGAQEKGRKSFETVPNRLKFFLGKFNL